MQAAQSSPAAASPPYTFSVGTNASFPPLPEGMSLNATTGNVSSSLIGGQGTYAPVFVVTDSTNAQATQNISIAINGNNAFLANIFPSTSIFHHRVDAATTNLPVDTSPAAPMYSGYLPATVKPFFGNNSNAPFPNGIPAIASSLQPGGRIGYDHLISVLLYLWSNSRECSGGRHQQLDGRSTRSGLPGGRRRKQPCPLRDVAGNLRRRSLDRFLERALAQRIFECPDSARAGNIRCRRTSGSAAARQCRRGNRHRHTQLTEQVPFSIPSDSHSITC